MYLYIHVILLHTLFQQASQQKKISENIIYIMVCLNCYHFLQLTHNVSKVPLIPVSFNRLKELKRRIVPILSPGIKIHSNFPCEIYNDNHRANLNLSLGGQINQEGWGTSEGVNSIIEDPGFSYEAQLSHRLHSSIQRLWRGVGKAGERFSRISLVLLCL